MLEKKGKQRKDSRKGNLRVEEGGGGDGGWEYTSVFQRRKEYVAQLYCGG